MTAASVARHAGQELPATSEGCPCRREPGARVAKENRNRIGAARRPAAITLPQPFPHIDAAGSLVG